MPSNVTQKQVAGLLRQGSVKVLFYLFQHFIKESVYFDIDSTHLGFFSPKFECISFIYMNLFSFCWAF